MKDISIPPTSIETLTKQLEVLANPKRLQISHLLMEGVQCNCELGDALDMPINMISHHMGLLRKAGLVNIERDTVDARWVYFSLNEPAMATLNETYNTFFDLARIQPRHPQCGLQSNVVGVEEVTLT